MTEAQLMRVDIALESANGDRVLAARALGIDPRPLKDLIRDNAVLRDKWLGQGYGPQKGSSVELKGAPTPEETLTMGEVKPAELSKKEQYGIAAIDHDDKALSKGFKALGLADNEVAEAKSMVKFHSAFAAKTVDLFGACLAKRGIRLSMLCEKLEADIKAQNYRDIWSPDGALLVRSGEESKHELLLACLAELRRMVELSHTSALTRAKIDMWARQGGSSPNGKGKNRRPGFDPLKRPAPLLINNQAGATVNVNGDKVEPGQDAAK